MRYQRLPRYQTFLLDCSNHILALGIPVLKPKIKELYKKIMSDDTIQKCSVKISMVNKQIRNLGLINKGDPINLSFYMLNKDSLTYHILDIIPSCDCIWLKTKISFLTLGKK